MVRYYKNDLKAAKPEALAEIKRVIGIKEEIVRKIPELAYCLQPSTLQFSLKWPEKNFSERDKNYLKQTLKILSRKWYPYFAANWSLRFQPLDFEVIQEGGATVYKAQITQMVPFKRLDEHTYRTYGVEEYLTGEWEEGIWVEVREERGRRPEILLKCKRSDSAKGVPTSHRLNDLEVKVVDEKTMEFGIDARKVKEVIDHLRETFG